MIIRRNIQVKAAFLMLVFSLNTFVGFACAISKNGAADKHEEQLKSEEGTIHIHPDGKKHVHQAKKKDPHHSHAKGLVKDHSKKHSHENESATLASTQPATEAKHHRDDGDNDHEAKPGGDNCCNTEQNNSNNCCTEKVVKFNQLDKSASNSLSIAFSPVFFTTFLASFYYVDDLYISYINTGKKYFVRSHHPPIPDIRVEIQSFQI